MTARTPDAWVPEGSPGNRWAARRALSPEFRSPFLIAVGNAEDRGVRSGVTVILPERGGGGRGGRGSVERRREGLGGVPSYRALYGDKLTAPS